MEPSCQPDQDPLDAISAACDSLILGYTRRFDPITAKGDWHLRLAWIPDGQPEVVYDIDYRSGQPSIVLTRFLTSAWRLFQQHGFEQVEVPVEIGVMDLPKDHSIVEIVAEGIPRRCANLTQAVHHGEQLPLWFRDVAGEYLATVWEPYERAGEVGSWVELINSVRGAAGLVPRAFVAG